MRHRTVLGVAGRGERRHLPVRRDAPLLEGGEHFEAGVFAVARLGHVAHGLGEGPQVILERRCLPVPGRPQRAVVVLELRDLDQAPLPAVELAVVRVRVVDAVGADKLPSGVVGPGVEGAGEHEPVALVVAADLLTPVPTRVEEGPDLVVLAVAHEDDFLGAHARDHEVPGVGNQALVADEQPAASEDLLQLLLEDVRVHVQLAAQGAVLGVDERPQRSVPPRGVDHDQGDPPIPFTFRRQVGLSALKRTMQSLSSAVGATPRSASRPPYHAFQYHSQTRRSEPARRGRDEHS